MKPDFLGIGAPRSATSWLHERLRRHPDLWLPPVKELHYFDALRTASRAAYPVPDRDPNALARRFASRHRRAMLRALLRGDARGPDRRFALRMLRAPRQDAGYAALFPRDRVAGEITPAYMMLAPEVVDALAARWPSLRILLLLRNPIERVWSGTRQFVLRGGPFDADARARAVERFQSPGVVLRSDYLGALDRWEQAFSPGQVFVGFYDEVVASPRDLLERVLAFLGVDPHPDVLGDALATPVNQAPPAALPDELRLLLAEQYAAPIGALAERFGGAPAGWLAELEALLGPARLRDARARATRRAGS